MIKYLGNKTMKGFLKNVLATIVGVAIIAILIVLVFSSVLLSGITSKDYKLEDNTVLVLRLNGVLKDRVQTDPLSEFLGLSDISEMALTDISSAIKKAKENDKIKGIYIHAGMLYASNASLLELRNDLLDFKESGKFIVAYGDIYMQGSYFLSSVADKIILNPQGNLDLHGLSSSRTFYKGLFEKIGVEMQIFKVGTYKSAVEPYTQDKMSDANREQVSSYVNDIWKTLLTEISESRQITTDQLNSIADTLPTFKDPQWVLEKKLVDTLMYESEVKKYIADLIGVKEISDIELASIADMQSVDFVDERKSDNRIAILYAEGSIKSGDESSDINDRYYIKQLEKLKDDDKVKAVVFRINSGGGSAYASEQIWKAVSDLKEKKPIVVSMGDLAASGGYYIAANASMIIAQPSTLTGSIGIFGMFPNVEGLTQKLGMTFDGVKTNKFSDFGEITRPMNREEKAILQEYINRGYDLFLNRCAEGRGISRDSINVIAQGRVWTGNQALKIGLVDALGGIDKAIEYAVTLANLNDYEIKEYPVQGNFFEDIFSKKREELAVKTLKEYFGSDYELIKMIREIKELKEQDFIQARLPYDFEVK